MNAIEIRKLHKSYGNARVLNDINLEVQQGSIFALLGPNGAGKTTTVRILATLLGFDSGKAKIFGRDVVKEADAVRKRISLTGQFASVDEDLTGTENLILIARLLGNSWSASKARASELLQAFELTEAGKRQVKHYSGGMRRRLDIAASIVVSPDLLFLDEPTTGLDPRSRRSIWDIIRSLRDAGTTILLTTQYLEEADELADRIVIIDRGSIIADGTPNELKASVGAGILSIHLSRKEQNHIAREIIAKIPGILLQPEAHSASTLSAHVTQPEHLSDMFSALSEAGIELTEFSFGQPDLDEVFLSLTGQVNKNKQETEEVFSA